MAMKADLILASNAVFTGLDNEPKPGFVAIKGNAIIAVDEREQMAAYLDEHTRVKEYGDQLIMPGFHDFHVHVLLGSLQEDNVNLIQARSEQEAAQMVADFARTRPDVPWVLGFCWYHPYWDEKQLPHRASLDALIPDRPVFLLHAAAHIAWLNSKALELLQIHRDTPDPAAGEIVRDENGEPTGILIENAIALAKEAFRLPDKDAKRIFRMFLDKAASLGVTSVHDMLPLPAIELGDVELYEAFDNNDELTVRIHFLTTLNGDLERAKALREKYRSARLQFSGLKQFLDGIVTAHTALLVEPYADKPETCGESTLAPELVTQWVKAADREGFRLRFHAVGDGAVRLALDAYEAAQQENGRRDSRHTIEHIELVHPDDLSRFNELGVIASLQPEHFGLANRKHYLAKIGEEREKYTFVNRMLKEAGATIALGTDFPIVSFNPMLEIFRAVSRKSTDGNLWNEQEAIPLDQALRDYTLAPAYGAFREHELGTLQPGKLADVIVLDRNPFAASFDELPETTVALTVMDGKIVFEK